MASKRNGEAVVPIFIGRGAPFRTKTANCYSHGVFCDCKAGDESRRLNQALIDAGMIKGHA